MKIQNRDRDRADFPAPGVGCGPDFSLHDAMMLYATCVYVYVMYMYM